METMLVRNSRYHHYLVNLYEQGILYSKYTNNKNLTKKNK